MKEIKNLSEFSVKNRNKNIYNALIKIPGVNFAIIKKLELINGLSFFLKISEITPNVLLLIRDQLVFYYDLEKNKILKNINKYKKIKNYRGMRHILRLPVRGQRTHTNAQTIKSYNKKEI